MYGGFNIAIKKILQREQENPIFNGPGMIDDFQVPGMPEHPGTPPAPISLSETAGLAVCGETGMVGHESEPLDRRALGRGRNSVRANRPETATKSQGNLFFSGG